MVDIAFSDECFVISPIGDEGSATRDRADGVLQYIIAPAAADVGLQTVRADAIAAPGMITRQVIEHVLQARAAVVDLSGANPNVYYEMAIRHTAQLPTVLIANKSEKLPFDIQQMRTVFFDHTSLKSAAECKAQIAGHLKEALEGAVESPVVTSLNLQNLRAGNPQEQVLAALLNSVEALGERLQRQAGLTEMLFHETMVVREQWEPSNQAMFDLIRSHERLETYARGREDEELRALLSEIAGPLQDLTHRFARRHALREPRAERAAAASSRTEAIAVARRNRESAVAAELQRTRDAEAHRAAIEPGRS